MLRKLILLLLLSGYLLSACAQQEPVAPPAGSDAQPEATQAPPTLAAPTQPESTATALPDPTATATPAPIVIIDGTGEEIRLEGPAQRVVSLAPSNTEMLFAVGAGAQVVGRDSFSDYPAEVAAITDIGELYGGLNVEVILSLQPDLILAADITAAEQISAIKDAGLTVFVVPNPVELAELFDRLLLVARLTGHESEANTLVESLIARVSAVEEKLASVQERPLVFYELDGTDPNAPWTAGPGTFVDILIEKAGGENIGAQLEGAWVQMSIEALIQADPELILLGDTTWGGVTPENVAARAGWETLSAVKENRVLPFDDNLVSRPGPRMVEGLEQLARLFHPELFE